MVNVHKFGGAALENPHVIQSIPSFLDDQTDKPIILVVSAMGNATRQLEKVFQQYLHQQDYTLALDQVYQFHQSIINALFGDEGVAILTELNDWKRVIREELATNCPANETEQRYSQLIAWGEILSSKIVHHYFLHRGISFVWLDVRRYIKTKQGFMDANLDEDLTYALLQEAVLPLLKKGTKILTQGFIASDGTGRTTTLGKEGSDYTAAILAAALGATSLTIWKDVPGIMNSDPKWADHPILFEELDYETMAKMSFYGAQVVHPNTIAPLARHNIALRIRSFKDHATKGTHVNNHASNPIHHSIYILKKEQLFATLSKESLSFFEEHDLVVVFERLHRLQLQATFIARTPYCLSLCLNDDKVKSVAWLRLIEPLYRVETYPNAMLLTVLASESKTDQLGDNLVAGKKVLARQQQQGSLQTVFIGPEHWHLPSSMPLKRPYTRQEDL